MSAESDGGELRTTVLVDYGQWYLFDPERIETDLSVLVGDPVRDAELWERRCASTGGAAIVYTLKPHDDTAVVARSVPGPSALEGADHVAEFSMVVPSGRLALTGWDTSVISGTLDVPVEPVRVRVGWFGLTRARESDDHAAEAFGVEVFPGPAGPVWSPYPTLPDGTGSVTGLWRDPSDDSRWAFGSGSGSHQRLFELTLEEARDLEAQGFPSVRTYAIDGDGRIWTSDVMPLERVPCLNLVPPWQFEMMKGLSGGPVGTQVIDLPPGWGRLVLLSRDGASREEVAAVDEAIDGFYQRWRDDQPPPIS